MIKKVLATFVIDNHSGLVLHCGKKSEAIPSAGFIHEFFKILDGPKFNRSEAGILKKLIKATSNFNNIMGEEAKIKESPRKK